MFAQKFDQVIFEKTVSAATLLVAAHSVCDLLRRTLRVWPFEPAQEARLYACAAARNETW